MPTFENKQFMKQSMEYCVFPFFHEHGKPRINYNWNSCKDNSL